MPDMILQAFGKNIRNLRLQSGISQEELARRSGVHRTYIGGIERGERNVSLVNIVAITEALGVPISKCLKNIGKKLNDDKNS